MAPRKPELLDLLRKREGRNEGPGIPPGPKSPRVPFQSRRQLPPWVPLVLVVVVLAGLVWLGSGLLGGGDHYTIDAGSWYGEAQQAEAVRYAQPLKAQAEQAHGAIYIELLKTGQQDGTIAYQIVIGKAAKVSELASLLEWVQGVTLPELPAGERPFADAKIVPLPN